MRIPDSASKVKKRCAKCGKKFEVFKSQDRQKHCSRECSDASRHTGITRKCKGCGKPFWLTPSIQKQHDPKYCSIKCKVAHKKPVLTTCPHCGQQFEPPKTHMSQKFCKRSCYEASRKRGAENGGKESLPDVQNAD